MFTIKNQKSVYPLIPREFYCDLFIRRWQFKQAYESRTDYSLATLYGCEASERRFRG